MYSFVCAVGGRTPIRPTEGEIGQIGQLKYSNRYVVDIEEIEARMGECCRVKDITSPVPGFTGVTADLL